MLGDTTMKMTPDKCRDQAAATAATKLLNSAKKSLTKHRPKKAKLSLQKASTSTAVTMSSAFSTDLNDTQEFKSVSKKSVARLQLAIRKRKKAYENEEDKGTKNSRQEASMAEISDRCPKLIPVLDIDSVLSIYRKHPSAKLQACSAERVMSGEELHDSPPILSLEGEFVSGESVGEVIGHDSDTSSSQLQTNEDESLSVTLHTCPACGEMLRHGKFVRHIQQCIKQHYDDEDLLCEEMPKDHDTQPASVDQRISVQDGAESLPSEYVFCQLCQKDLSHLNSYYRQLHTNKCIDKEEKKKAEETERRRALEAAKTQVLDCPMCGKPLRTMTSRKLHLKKCASKLGVGPDQLLAVVKHQEKEHHATLAAGILPVRPGRSSRQNATRKTGSVPKSKLDEDTQLALALSSSLQPDNQDAGTSAIATARRGRKNKQEEDYLLLKLSQSEAAGRIEARVSDLITKEVGEEEQDIPPLPPLNERALSGQTIQWTSREADQQCTTFWKLSALENSAENNEASTSRLQFYVLALMPPVEVSSVTIGSKMRRMSEIPGRRRSLEAGKNMMEEEVSNEQVDEEDGQDNGHLPPFSTQTAALLADMAAEADGKDQLMQMSLSQSSQISGDTECQVQQDLLSAFSSLVNQKQYSDAVIRTAQSTSLYAHRVILSVRCPSLLQLLNMETGVVELCEWSEQCVLAVLRFVYAGEAPTDAQVLLDTQRLARRLDLSSLAEICKSRMESSISPKVSLSGNEEERRKTLIKQPAPADCSTLTELPSTGDDRRDSAASSVGEDCEQLSPPVLEPCPAESSPPDLDFMDISSPQEHSDSVSPEKQSKYVSPQKQRDCQSPRKQSSSFSPQKHRHSFSPQRQRDSFSPQTQHDSFSPQTQRDSFSPQTQRDSFRPRKESECLSAVKQNDSDHQLLIPQSHSQSPTKASMQTTEGHGPFLSQTLTGMPVTAVGDLQNVTPERAKKGVQMREGLEDFHLHDHMEFANYAEFQRVESQESLQVTVHNRGSLRETDSISDCEGEAVSALKAPVGCTVSTENSDQQSDDMKVVSEESFEDGNFSIKTMPSDETDDTDSFTVPHSSQTLCSDRVNEFISSQSKKAAECQQNSVDSENLKTEKSGVVQDLQNNHFLSSKQSKVSTSAKYTKPVDSIEVSDEDLFSSNDEDVLLIPYSSPLPADKQHCGEKEADRGNSWDSSFICEAGTEPLFMPTASESGQKSVGIDRKSGEEDRHEKAKAEDTCCLTSDQRTDEQNYVHLAFEKNLSSVSLSAIECSHQRSSLSNPKYKHFQTSTPDVLANDRPTRRAVSKVKETSCVQETCTSQSYSVLDANSSSINRFSTSTATFRHEELPKDSRIKGSDSESVSKAKIKGTPCMSVVEQDSLYITPAEKHSNVRRTFQLVTPVPQPRHDSSSALTTPFSHCTTASVHSVRSYDSDEEKNLHEKNNKSYTPLLKEMCSFMADGSDSSSDLEIIEASVEHQPSPKFGTQTRQSRSQSQSQSEQLAFTLSQPRNQPSLQPKSRRSDDSLSDISPSESSSQTKARSQSKSKSPSKTATSPSWQFEHHRVVTQIASKVNPRVNQIPSKASPRAIQSLSKASPRASQFLSKASESPWKDSPKENGSPCKDSPSGLWSRSYSRRSAESDKELLRVSEMMGKGQQMTGGTGSGGTNSDMADANRSAVDDIWEGFDDFSEYNPDLNLEAVEGNPGLNPGSQHDGKKTPSPRPGPELTTESLSRTTAVDQSKASPFKTPTASPGKSGEVFLRKSAGKEPSAAHSKGGSPQTSYKKQDTPVKFRTMSSQDTHRSSKRMCDTSHESESNRKGNVQVNTTQSSQHSSLKEENSFLLDDDYIEAFNSSFLWSEENVPSEERGSGVCGDDEASRLAALELGREETVTCQDVERQLLHTPHQMRPTDRRGGKQAWVPPSPFTPMPAYDEMTTPQLKNEVGKFGLKPVGKKRMRLVLKDIYHKTHQYETDEDDSNINQLPNLGPPVLVKEARLQHGTHTTQQQQKQAPLLHRESSIPQGRHPDDDVEARPPPMLSKSPKKIRKLPPSREGREEPPVLCREGKSRPKTKRGLAQKSTDLSKAQNVNRAERKAQEGSVLRIQQGLLYQSPTKGNGSGGGTQTRACMESPSKTSAAGDSSSPEKGIFSSQDSDASEQPDMSVFEEGRQDSDDEDVAETTPSQQRAAKDLPQKLMAFIQNNADLYHKVLTYEPLDLGELKNDLKASGIRCSQQKLLDFLDEKCITFTTKTMLPRKHRRQKAKPHSRNVPASQKS